MEGYLALHPQERNLWADFLPRHPATLGEERIVHILGILCSLVYNTHIGKKADARAPQYFIEMVLPSADDTGEEGPKRDPNSLWSRVGQDHIRQLRRADAELRAAEAKAQATEDLASG